ncbi:MAG: hypothetical protein AAGM22_12415 [Acidobacteriota bacterium]
MAFGASYPALELLARHPPFLSAHDADAADAVILAIVLGLALPLTWGLLALGPSRGRNRLQRILLGGLLALPAGLVVAPWVGPVGGPVLAVGAAGLLGVGLAVARRRSRPLRLFLTALSPAILIFPSIFLARAPQLWPRAPVPPRLALAPDASAVIVVFDEFPAAVLLDAEGRIDGARYPNFAELAAGSTWFTHARTVFTKTEVAVPSMLVGRYPDPSWNERPDQANFDENLLSLLAGSARLDTPRARHSAGAPRLRRRSSASGGAGAPDSPARRAVAGPWLGLSAPHYPGGLASSPPGPGWRVDGLRRAPGDDEARR